VLSHFGFFGIEPPKPRIEAFLRIVDMSASIAGAESAVAFSRTSSTHLDHDRPRRN
jgi:hypothetical protein